MYMIEHYCARSFYYISSFFFYLFHKWFFYNQQLINIFEKIGWQKSLIPFL